MSWGTTSGSHFLAQNPPTGTVFDTGGAENNFLAPKYRAIGTWDPVAGTGDMAAAFVQAATDTVALGGGQGGKLRVPGALYRHATDIVLGQAIASRLSIEGPADSAARFNYVGAGTALTLGDIVTDTQGIRLSNVRWDLGGASAGSNAIKLLRVTWGNLEDVMVAGRTSGGDNGVGIQLDGTGNYTIYVHMRRVGVTGNYTKGYFCTGPASNTCNAHTFTQVFAARTTAKPGTGTIGFHWGSAGGDSKIEVTDMYGYDIAYQVDGSFLTGTARCEQCTTGINFGANAANNDLLLLPFNVTTKRVGLGLAFNSVRDTIGTQNNVNTNAGNATFQLTEQSDNLLDITLQAGSTAEQSERIVFRSRAGADQWRIDRKSFNELHITNATTSVAAFKTPAGPVMAMQTALAYARKTPAYGASVAIAADTGNEFVITPTDGVGFTIANPTGLSTGERFTVRIKNTFGVLGAATWGGIYKLAAWTQPANGFSRSIDFQYDGTNCIEVGRTTVDVPN